ncbi:MAG: YggS family pyridoxal phosphate-dependent enzyme [Gemmatimonadota bacterium]
MAVRDSIADACAGMGRDPAEVRIVAITKGHPAETVHAAIRAGLTDIGENRVQEALAKLGPDVRPEGASPIRWHMVGHLQRNKVRDAVALFDWVQSIDSLRLARAISGRVDEGRPVQVLIEVNAGGEAQKHGLAPERGVETALAVAELPGLEFRGVMAMAPWTEDERAIRAAFRVARGVFESLRERVGARVDTLSMGMSNDYGVAVEEGATMIRLGTALFGERG